MDTINIFWIEDNPFKGLDPNEILVPELRPTLVSSSLLNFTFFQHPVEIKEYLQMVNAVILENGPSALSSCRHCIPDIIVFDYKLTDNLNGTNGTSLQYNNRTHRNFIKDHSAAFKLKDTFAMFKDRELFIDRKDIREGNYSGQSFRKEVGLDPRKPINDEFGLFAGLTILRLFSNYITLGVPATTTRARKDQMSENALFFEWLNSYDIEDSIKRPDRESKGWDDILRFALPQLQARTEIQHRQGIVHLSYQQLINYSSESMSEKQEDRVLTITSAYGRKDLPIDGLFADSPKKDRAQILAKWAERRLKDLSRGIGPNTNIVPQAIDKSQRIWNYYKTHFLERIMLSFFSVNAEALKAELAEHQQEAAALNKAYVKGNQIISQYSIESEFSGKIEPALYRLVMLFLGTRLYINHRNSSLNDASNPSSAQINFPLSKDDYYNVLFPFVNSTDSAGYNRLHLLMHNSKISPSDYYGAFEKRLKSNVPSISTEKSEWWLFSKWISPGERRILISFFQDELNNTTMPEWLK